MAGAMLLPRMVLSKSAGVSPSCEASGSKRCARSTRNAATARVVPCPCPSVMGWQRLPRRTTGLLTLELDGHRDLGVGEAGLSASLEVCGVVHAFGPFRAHDLAKGFRRSGEGRSDLEYASRILPGGRVDPVIGKPHVGDLVRPLRLEELHHLLVTMFTGVLDPVGDGIETSRFEAPILDGEPADERVDVSDDPILEVEDRVLPHVPAA